MTPQESSMLEDLVRKVEETQLTEKDPEAEQLLQQGLGRDPDAIYKLAQTVLVQNLALNQARAQIQQLQQQQIQPQQPARATSFLGSLLGHRDPAPAAPQPQAQYQPVPAYQPQYPAQYQAPPQYAAAPPPSYAPPAPSPVGGFLRSAATTAAGVAAGALAFEGIESLMHHGGGGFGGGSGGGFGAPPVEETVINNYYDDPQQQGGFAEHREHEASYDDRPDSQASLHDASYQPDTDPTSFDDTQGDDFGSGDDFGGGDDSNLV